MIGANEDFGQNEPGRDKREASDGSSFAAVEAGSELARRCGRGRRGARRS